MTETSDSELVSTKQQRIAELARRSPTMVIKTLAHHIDLGWMREAHRRTRKDGAAGVDGQTAADFERALEENLRGLLEQAKSGSYRAPPVRRVHIPKGDGSRTRPLGIPTFADKVLQRAVQMVLEPVYEQDFLPCSFGFRPGRNAHQALHSLRDSLMSMHGGWVLEVDVRSFFDTLDHRHLQQIVRQRVGDGVLTRLIGKWLNAGVLESGVRSTSDTGTPQGGVISPLLANVYLHEVLDRWIELEVRPRMRGAMHLVRYADDFVLVFADETDARRVYDVLPERFAKYGLTLHPDKTRLVPFRRPPLRPDASSSAEAPGTFELLGFTLHWGRTQRGLNVVQLRTSSSRLTRSLNALRAWCASHRHDPVREQHATLVQKIRGHVQYFGVRDNHSGVARFVHWATLIWWKWLARRSRERTLTWARMRELLRRYPLPNARVVHRLA